MLCLAVFGTFYYNVNVDSLTNERFYLRGVFPWLRKGYDYTLGYLPFPFLYIMVPVLLVLLGLGVRDLVKSFSSGAVVSFFRRLVNVVCIAYLVFYWSWALNYKNRPLQKQLNLISIEVDSNLVFQEATYVMSQLIPLRDSLSRDTLPLLDMMYPNDTELKLRKSMTALLTSWYLPHDGRVRVRQIRPKGILLHIATAGVYIPFVFEGHIDAGLPKIQWPFTMAHEMSHGYGVTDEGECNFIAVLVCQNTDDPYIMYSGKLTYWRYLANSLYQVSPRLGQKLINQRSTSVSNDISHIRKTLDAYPDYMPKLRDLIYDSYLRSHGVASGIASYGKVVNLMQMWKKSYHDRELYDKIYREENNTLGVKKL